MNRDGSTDSTFGTNGQVVTDFGAADLCYSSNLQDDGKIVCAGQQYPLDGGNERNILIARYIGDPVKQLGPIAKKIRRWIRNHILQWQPVNDNDVAYYSIQQSSNGVNGFKEVGRVSQNSKVKSKNEEAVYSYSLNNASSSNIQNATSNTNYYRVTAVSNNGSNIVSDVIKDESVSFITISPNPVINIMKITGLPAGVKSTIHIINRNGNVVQSAICNNTICNINVAQLHNGLYSVQVKNDKSIYNATFIKE